MYGKRLAIVGTSTSIMKDGYAPFLKDLLPDTEIVNLSLGGAPSIYGCYVVEQEKIADEFDYAIIDFCINDQQLERNAFLTIENIVSAFGALISRFSSGSRCKPLVLLLPQREAFVDARLMKVRNLSKKICHQFGVKTIDVFDLLDHGHELFGLDRGTFFSDWTHMHKNHAEAFAKLIVETLPTIENAKKSDLKFPTYSVVVPSGLESVERGTSHVSSTTFVLTREKAAPMRVDGYLCGFLHWQNSDTGTFLLETSWEKLALPARKIAPWDNRFAFSNFATAVKCSGFVNLSVGTDPEFKTMRSFGYQAHLPRDGSEIGICGFVFAHEDPQAVGARVIDILNKKRFRAQRLARPEWDFIRTMSGPVSQSAKIRILAKLFLTGIKGIFVRSHH